MRKVSTFPLIGVFLSLSVLISTLVFALPSWALDRATQDRPDDFSGYQIHAVYVVPKGGNDARLDIDNTINTWIQSSQSLLLSQLGRKFIYDTYKGEVDVTFMQSKYEVRELCYETCQTLQKLEEELEQQTKTPMGNKTILFFMRNQLESAYCGWANRPGNLAGVFFDASSNCNAAWTITHELIHTYGIGHTCFSAEDLMLGDCAIKRHTTTSITIDAPRSNYVNSERLNGIDLLQMPIWSDGSGKKEYANVPSNSGDKYIPKLKDGTVYAVVGKPTYSFAWTWSKNIFPDEGSLECTMTYGTKTISGIAKKSACTFDVPDNWRVGSSFEVSQKWSKGPWYGSTSASGILLREDFTSNPCNQTVCFVGGSTVLPSYCWKTSSNEISLQKLIRDVWQTLDTVPLVSSESCSAEYPKQPKYTATFDTQGLNVYRWYIKNSPGVSAYTDTPFAVVVSGADEREATEAEIAAAKLSALQRGSEADLVPPQTRTSCEITNSGLMCKSLIEDKQNWKITGMETFDWFISSATGLTNPQNLSGYPIGSLFKTTSSSNASSSLGISLDELIKISAVPESFLRIYAIARNASGKGNEVPGISSIVAFSDIKNKVEIAIAQAKAKASITEKKTTIACIKGKLTKKVTAINPKCPAGFKKK
jgi:hypothetical protein